MAQNLGPSSDFRDPRAWGVYLVTDRNQSSGRDLVEVVARALQGGIRSVQLREKDLDSLELFRLGQRLMQVCREAGAALVINDRVDIALALDADGVHLSNKSLPAPEARKLLGPGKLLGVSCHSIEQVRSAAAGGWLPLLGVRIHWCLNGQ